MQTQVGSPESSQQKRRLYYGGGLRPWHAKGVETAGGLMLLPDLAHIKLPVVYSQITPADSTFEGGFPDRNSWDLLKCPTQAGTIFDGLAHGIGWQVDLAERHANVHSEELE